MRVRYQVYFFWWIWWFKPCGIYWPIWLIWSTKMWISKRDRVGWTSDLDVWWVLFFFSLGIQLCGHGHPRNCDRGDKPPPLSNYFGVRQGEFWLTTERPIFFWDFKCHLQVFVEDGPHLLADWPSSLPFRGDQRVSSNFPPVQSWLFDASIQLSFPHHDCYPILVGAIPSLNPPPSQKIWSLNSKIWGPQLPGGLFIFLGYPVVRELRSYGYSMVFIFPMNWGAQELPGVSQPHILKSNSRYMESMWLGIYIYISPGIYCGCQ